jgi:hypothetical protein
VLFITKKGKQVGDYSCAHKYIMRLFDGVSGCTPAGVLCQRRSTCTVCGDSRASAAQWERCIKIYESDAVGGCLSDSEAYADLDCPRCRVKALHKTQKSVPITPRQKFKIHSKTISKFNDLNAPGAPFATPAAQEKICG